MGTKRIPKISKIIGTSATKSWKKSRSFSYGSSEYFLSKGQEADWGGGGFFPFSGLYRVNWRIDSLYINFLIVTKTIGIMRLLSLMSSALKRSK